MSYKSRTTLTPNSLGHRCSSFPVGGIEINTHVVPRAAAVDTDNCSSS